ncbi:hypothetical protein [Zhongshania sp. BJYM1]|uniref:hypothetical protein n=1 Tax=Zhongshania aquatica TaxID=2965069 RepID=UPI0022B4C6EB|nr:hypothetical protein [Marortus sp. BJYM1]
MCAINFNRMRSATLVRRLQWIANLAIGLQRAMTRNAPAFETTALALILELPLHINQQSPALRRQMSRESRIMLVDDSNRAESAQAGGVGIAPHPCPGRCSVGHGPRL